MVGTHPAIKPSHASKVRHTAVQSTPATCTSASRLALTSDVCVPLPFLEIDDDALSTLPLPAKPLLRPSTLTENCFILPCNKVFIDKVLPPSSVELAQDVMFPLEYFVALHRLVSASGTTYPADTPNHLGARIPLRHTKLNIPRWRHHLIGYEGAELVQLLEFGFPIGLEDNSRQSLVPSLQNHGSSYQFYTYLDKFLAAGLERCELSGPCTSPPFHRVHVSPLMTAAKKPDGRRSVFDATFGEMSLNNCTPQDTYLEQPFTYDFPKIEDFKRIVLKCGQGSYLWKRDLSRYYLQLPVDPIEYPLLCFVWRFTMFFFVALMFGLKHAGLQGQKVTTAVTWVHRRLGLETDHQEMYNSLNYCDDIGGGESSLERAEESFNALGSLFLDLGLDESRAKAHPPSTSMPYLGIQFDTVLMRMSIPPDKIEEVREEISLWMKRKSASKKSLQQLLGKLFWVSRAVKYSRGFMGRLLTQLQQLHALPHQRQVKLSVGCKEDIEWWHRYLRRFNGIEMLYPTDPLSLPLNDLLDTCSLVNCGDAQPNGGGAYFGNEYWSRSFPEWLQDKTIPIHIKEFFVVVASAWLWGDQWKGHLVYVFCDNTAVVEVLEKERPKDPKMLKLLQEYLYIVCTRGFTPVFRTVGTKENEVADYISRNHDPVRTAAFFKSKGLPMRTQIPVNDNLFKLRSNW